MNFESSQPVSREPTELQLSRRVDFAPELWGGVECTLNRVGDCYIDQLELSGHALRHEDIDLFAELGVRALRTGLIWERSPLDPEGRYADQHFARMRAAGIRPIAGLVHHGSGPKHISLIHPEFATELASYAHRVAERYPWIDAYTPVNEPNTTARFSGLYGVWYPHHMSRRSYLLALMHEVKATVLAMQEIRRINPRAQLVQTEDLGDVHGTDALRDVTELLCARRWLGFDLLCGRVERHHPLFDYIRREGFTEADILWFRDHPCPPDVIGINYYLTSDRFLDHRVERYPASRRSAEGPMVDVEAVRLDWPGITGWGPLIQETWNRYHIPIALTEVHLGGRVHDQIRWLAEAWRGIAEARRNGAQCNAITLWALLGSFYWNELVTRPNGHYEPGVFDISNGTPRPTELAAVAAQIARGQQPSHPALRDAGWWRRADRVLFNRDSWEREADVA